MKSPDRMFRVLVLGGIGLTACGGAITTGSSSDSGSGNDGFPHEGPDAALEFDGFPTEGPDTYTVDSGQDATGLDAGCFPRETAIMWDGCTPPPPDSGGGDDATVDGGTTDSSATDGGAAVDSFPQEGPARIDF
jgi:hypothetical protein